MQFKASAHQIDVNVVVLVVGLAIHVEVVDPNLQICDVGVEVEEVGCLVHHLGFCSEAILYYAH